jgi:hypothetical protein
MSIHNLSSNLGPYILLRPTTNFNNMVITYNPYEYRKYKEEINKVVWEEFTTEPYETSDNPICPTEDYSTPINSGFSLFYDQEEDKYITAGK